MIFCVIIHDNLYACLPSKQERKPEQLSGSLYSPVLLQLSDGPSKIPRVEVAAFNIGQESPHIPCDSFFLVKKSHIFRLWRGYMLPENHQDL